MDVNAFLTFQLFPYLTLYASLLVMFMTNNFQFSFIHRNSQYWELKHFCNYILAWWNLYVTKQCFFFVHAFSYLQMILSAYKRARSYLHKQNSCVFITKYRLQRFSCSITIRTYHNLFSSVTYSCCMEYKRYINNL